MAAHPRIAFIGEAWGAEEEAASEANGRPTPFVGAAGKLFNTLLKVCGITREITKLDSGKLQVTQPPWMLVTNVFNLRPQYSNDVKGLLVPKKEAEPSWIERPWERGKYLPPDLLPEITRLRDELTRFKPAMIVALGKTPLWALLHHTGIMERRGTLHFCLFAEGTGARGQREVPLIPTIHPSFVLRQYQWFTLAALDIRKAVQYARGEIQVEALDYVEEPLLKDLNWLRKHPGPITFDIETRPTFGAISCIGLGTAEKAICVPLVHEGRPGRSYWKTPGEEVAALKLVAEILENPRTTKIAHHAMYDVVWLREVLGIEVRGPLHDTIIMHRASFPELPHALGQVAPNYRLYSPWKSDYKASKAES